MVLGLIVPILMWGIFSRYNHHLYVSLRNNPVNNALAFWGGLLDEIKLIQIHRHLLYINNGSLGICS